MNNQENFKFRLYADCIPVKGHIRSAIYDLNRRIYRLVPNSMLEFIKESNGKTLDEIKKIYGLENSKIVEEYISLLEKSEFICWLPEVLLESFVSLDLAYDYPADITNAILDIDAQSNYSIVNALQQLESLGCKSVQIRSFSVKSLEFFSSVLIQFISSSYLSIEIITMFVNDYDESKISEFIQLFPRLKSIVFHTAPYNKIINHNGEDMMGTLAYTNQQLQSCYDCHNNSYAYFNVSMQLFSESQLYHPYFNRKVSVDVEGYIKNCSSHKRKFGTIEQNHIANIINDREFQELWNVSRDKISVCQDCEFRYMCNDSTLPLKITDDIWKLSKECNYNPYIGKWKGEYGYLTVEQFQLVQNEKK